MARSITADASLRWRTPALLAPALAVVSIFFLAPFAILVAFSIGAVVRSGASSSGMTLSFFEKVLGEPLYQGIILRTVGIALVVTFLTLVIGYAMALALTSSRTRFRRLLVSLAVLPLMLSGVIRTFGWVVLLAQNGAVNTIALQLGLVDTPFRFLGTNLGVVIGLTHILLPFMVLAIASNLSYIHPSLRDAANGLGATPLRTFCRVTLPLSVPGIATGTLLVFIMSMGAFVTPAMLGYGRVKVLPMVVFEQTTAIVNWGLASAAAVTLLVITLAFLAVHRLVLKSQTGTRIGERGRALAA